MGRVMVLGSLNVDLVTQVDRLPQPGETVLGEGLVTLAGGKGGNQAMAAAAAGAQVLFVGCVGSDPGGTAYAQRLRAAGIDTTRLRVADDQRTGTALITVDDRGENSIVVIAGANADVGAQEVEAVDALGQGDVLLMQLEVPLTCVAAAARRAAHRGARVVINIAPYAALPGDVIELANPLVANEHEMSALAESGATPASLIVTFGAHGATWDGKQVAAHAVPAAQVVDTTGAGDAFSGALAAALAAGVDRAEALDRALAAGASAVRHTGAQPHPEL